MCLPCACKRGGLFGGFAAAARSGHRSLHGYLLPVLGERGTPKDADSLLYEVDTPEYAPTLRKTLCVAHPPRSGKSVAEEVTAGMQFHRASVRSLRRAECYGNSTGAPRPEERVCTG